MLEPNRKEIIENQIIHLKNKLIHTRASAVSAHNRGQVWVAEDEMDTAREIKKELRKQQQILADIVVDDRLSRLEEENRILRKRLSDSQDGTK